MKFELKDAHEFSLKDIKGWVYNSKEDFANASAAYIEINGTHGKIKNSLSDRIYYILDGTGKFVIDGKIISVEKTDVIIVPKNTPYDYMGKMKLFLVDCPAYDEKTEVKLEQKDNYLNK